MGKKNRYIEEEIPEAAQPAVQPLAADEEMEISPQSETDAENENLVTQKRLVADFEWDCGDTRYNIGDKVFRHGARLTGIPIDEDGSPTDAALKKAYELNYLKKKE